MNRVHFAVAATLISTTMFAGAVVAAQSTQLTRLGIHIRKGRRRTDELKKRAYIDTYLPHVGIALQQILGLSDTQKNDTIADLRQVLEKTRKID